MPSPIPPPPSGLSFSELEQQESDPVVVQPGETKTIHLVHPYSQESETVIVAMGVTQHPNTLYHYLSDGVRIGSKPSPYPLGEFHNPIWTCRDIGKWLIIGEEFALAVTNNDSEAHRYASILLTYDRTKV